MRYSFYHEKQEIALVTFYILCSSYLRFHERMTVDQYNECVDKFSDNVYRFILKSIRNEDKAKDIVQESYEKLWLKFETISFDKVKSYLFTTAYHTMIDMIRREKPFTDIETADLEKFVHNEQFNDLHEILHNAIQMLPEIQRTVLLLRDYEGYAYDEIGEITGLNESQVKVYIFRARSFLKNYIVKLETII